MNDWILYLLFLCSLGLIPLSYYLHHKRMGPLIVKDSVVVHRHPLETVVGVYTKEWGHLSGVFDHWGLTGYWRNLQYPYGMEKKKAIGILEYAKSVGEKE